MYFVGWCADFQVVVVQYPEIGLKLSWVEMLDRVAGVLARKYLFGLESESKALQSVFSTAMTALAYCAVVDLVHPPAQDHLIDYEERRTASAMRIEARGLTFVYPGTSRPAIKDIIDTWPSSREPAWPSWGK